MFAFGSTKPIEDGFQRLRVLEQRGQANQVVSCQRAWACLINRRILSQVHRFPEVDFSTVGLKRYHENLPKEPTKTWFTWWGGQGSVSTQQGKQLC